MSNNTPRLTIVNNSTVQQNHPNTTTTATAPIPRSTIDDFREIIREQSYVIPNSTNDVPIKKYPPLPDITIPTGVNPQFFRTEASLTQSKKQVFNHFAPPTTQRTIHLPTISKQQQQQLQTISNMMDLDEDLPQCYTNSINRAATYTSPGERIISPIKRPSAPSPPSSAQIKRLTESTFINGIDNDDDDDDDDEESQLFNEHFYHYHHQQPVIMPTRRIDHYKRPTIIINDGHHDELAHPLDSDDFQP